MKLRFPVVLFASTLLLLPTAHAQVLFTGTYSQDFNSLAAPTGSADVTGVSWTNNATLPGWYSTRTGTFIDNTTYIAGGAGVSSSASLWDFGPAGSGGVGNPDRALGVRASGGTSPQTFGIRLTNTTGSTLNSITISYTGEQWGQGTNSGATNLQTSLTFAYSLTAAGLGGSFTNVPGLNFTSPQPTIGGGTATTPLNGNASANQVAFNNVVLDLSGAGGWANGSDLWLRWTDTLVGTVNRDNGLSIDNLSIVPEPSAAGMILLGASMLFAATHRRRRRLNSYFSRPSTY